MERLKENNESRLIFHKLQTEQESIDEQQITIKNWVEYENDLVRESLCGVDERQKVVAALQPPYIAICKLYMLAQNNRTYVGSGWLVSNDRLYTAGHCVFDKNTGGWMKSIVVIPAKAGLNEPFGRYKAIEVAATEKWVKDKSVRYDMGAIKLDRPVPFNEFIIPKLADSDKGVVCGYPADRDNGLFQYKMEDYLQKESGRFNYFADTFGGQSGGVILKNRREGIAIHNYGGCPNNASDLYHGFIEEVANW